MPSTAGTLCGAWDSFWTSWIRRFIPVAPWPETMPCPHPGSGLILTTVDAARGQGWPHCIVIGTPHQVAPFGVDSSHDTREAAARQRRLYVAATRTRGRMAFIIHGRHGEGADEAKLLVEILGEETEYRNVGPQVPAHHNMPREGLGLA